MTMPPTNEPVIEPAAEDRPPITIADTLKQAAPAVAETGDDDDDETGDDEAGIVERPNRTLTLDELPESLLIALRSLHDKQGQNIVVFETIDLTPFYDYVILVNGLSSVQRDVLARTIREDLHQLKFNPLSVEGNGESGWILMDYRDFLVHILAPEKREYYHLETLWADMPKVESQEPGVIAALESFEEETEPEA